MIQSHQQDATSQPIGRRGWHNPLPGWILDHPKFSTLKPSARLLLQAIADSCDPPAREHELGPGTLDGAFGGTKYFAQRIGASDRNTRTVIHKLIDLGFLVRTSYGGRMRVVETRGTLTIASGYAIPGKGGDACAALGIVTERQIWPTRAANLAAYL